MKTILLLRHAKSSWSNPGLDDFDRPLAERGLKDAPRMGKFLKKIGYKPDYLVSSPAQRARETSLLCLEGMKNDKSIIKWDENLYFGLPRKYVEAIQKTPDNCDLMMIVGHNPLMESTASILSDSSESSAFRMPTAGLICLESYALHWKNIKPGTCQVKWMIIPKVLKSMLD